MQKRILEQSEHEAVVELLVLAEFADRLLTIDEQKTAETFTASHCWDSPTFSYATHYGVATSKVRSALGAKDQEDALIADIRSRIRHTELRSELAGVLDQLLPGNVGSDEVQDLAQRIRTSIA